MYLLQGTSNLNIDVEKDRNITKLDSLHFYAKIKFSFVVIFALTVNPLLVY